MRWPVHPQEGGSWSSSRGSQSKQRERFALCACNILVDFAHPLDGTWVEERVHDGQFWIWWSSQLSVFSWMMLSEAADHIRTGWEICCQRLISNGKFQSKHPTTMSWIIGGWNGASWSGQQNFPSVSLSPILCRSSGTHYLSMMMIMGACSPTRASSERRSQHGSQKSRTDIHAPSLWAIAQEHITSLWNDNYSDEGT